MWSKLKGSKGVFITFEENMLSIRLGSWHGCALIPRHGPVKVLSKLAAKGKGPAKILKCLGPVNCSVAFLDDLDHPDTFHVHNLKPFHGYVKPSNEGEGM